MGALHGHGIARRIKQVAQGALALNQGTIYPALLRLEQKGGFRANGGRAKTAVRLLGTMACSLQPASSETKGTTN
jgi:hypothetical protein